MKAFKGNIIFTKTEDKFEIYENQYLIVKDGRVVEIVEEIDSDAYEVYDYSDQLIIPGFVDLHTHAPQYRNSGIGLDQELLPWLKNYTFKEESKFENREYAEKIYDKFVEELLKNGTTNVVLFGTLHNESNKLLIDILENKKIEAFIGNVNMDQETPTSLSEETEHSIEKTYEILEYTKGKRIESIVTPRFVPSCTSELMDRLGDIAKKQKLPIQTHMSENKKEVELVKKLYPWIDNYIDVYEKYKLINSQTIFAHCVHSTMEERKKIRDYGAYVAHCPNANFNLASGIMPLRKFLEEGINVGLGTDVAAGHTLSIFDVMKSALQASKMKWYEDQTLSPVTTSEVFYLATKGGGKFFGNVGSFEKGYQFNALILKDEYDLFELSLEERIEHLIYAGDDRVIQKVFINGEEV